MSGKSRNEGVRVIAQFRDRAIPLANPPAKPATGEPGTRCVNEGIRALTEFTDPAQSPPPPRDEPGAPKPPPSATEEDSPKP